MARRKTKNFALGPIITLVIMILIVIALSFVFSKLGLTTTKSEIVNGEISTVNIGVNNILSKEGIKYFFSSILSGFKNLDAIYTFIIAMIGIGFADASGLFKKALKKSKKFKLSFVIILTLITGCLFGGLGLNSYAFLLPLAGYIYKNLGKNPIVGIMTMFIGLTMGQATGIIPTYLQQSLGTLTESSAIISVDTNYAYKNSSLLYILISSLVIFVLIGNIIIDKYLVPKVPKLKSEEEIEELEVEHKGLKKSTIAFVLMLIILAYFVIPGLPLSGGLLGDGKTYLIRLLGPSSPFRESYVFIFSLILVVCGTVFAISAKKIKNFDDFTRNFSHVLSGSSLVFVFAFFMSQLISLVEWSNINIVLTSLLVNWVSALEITGLGLIFIYFLAMIIAGILVPDTASKWTIIAPIAVPLLMRANISASFSQFIFTAADGIGKGLSLFFPYTAIFFGLIYKYTESGDFGFIKVYKMLSPLIILFTILWLVIIITWYVVGIPTGIGVLPSL